MRELASEGKSTVNSKVLLELSCEVLRYETRFVMHIMEG